MDRFDDDTLVAELRELRPEPTPEFSAELDEWAAAGFPRRATASAGRFERLGRRLRSISFGQLMIPAVGTAIALIAVAIVVVAVSSGGGHSSDLRVATSAQSVTSESSGGGAGEAAGSEEAGEESEEAAEEVGAEAQAGEEAPKAGTAKGKFNGEFFDESSKEAGKSKAESGPGVAEEAEESAPEEEVETESSPATGTPRLSPPSVKGPALTGGHRDVERGTSMILGTKPGEVAGASQKVFEAVSAVKGYVLHSSVQSGTSGPTAATFSMLIPNRNLNDALAAFSQIGEVRQRHDATSDITAPTVSATEELRDSNASIEGLLKELGNAETEEERESVEARLREERRRHAGIRASLEHLHKRASLAEVSLRIVTPRGAGATPPPSKGSGGGWSVGDALHDAGHILTVAAGVLLIALAVLAPIALILLLIWLANRFRVRRLRERALG